MAVKKQFKQAGGLAAAFQSDLNRQLSNKRTIDPDYSPPQKLKYVSGKRGLAVNHAKKEDPDDTVITILEAYDTIDDVICLYNMGSRKWVCTPIPYDAKLCLWLISDKHYTTHYDYFEGSWDLALSNWNSHHALLNTQLQRIEDFGLNLSIKMNVYHQGIYPYETMTEHDTLPYEECHEYATLMPTVLGTYAEIVEELNEDLVELYTPNHEFIYKVVKPEVCRDHNFRVRYHPEHSQTWIDDLEAEELANLDETRKLIGVIFNTGLETGTVYHFGCQDSYDAFNVYCQGRDILLLDQVQNLGWVRLFANFIEDLIDDYEDTFVEPE